MSTCSKVQELQGAGASASALDPVCGKKTGSHFSSSQRNMDDKRTTAILGLKAELKTVRARVRELTAQNEKWRKVAGILRSIAALDEAQFQNLLRAEALN